MGSAELAPLLAIQDCAASPVTLDRPRPRAWRPGLGGSYGHFPPYDYLPSTTPTCKRTGIPNVIITSGFPKVYHLRTGCPSVVRCEENTENVRRLPLTWAMAGYYVGDKAHRPLLCKLCDKYANLMYMNNFKLRTCRKRKRPPQDSDSNPLGRASSSSRNSDSDSD
jgi:hypothetical protein